MKDFIPTRNPLQLFLTDYFFPMHYKSVECNDKLTRRRMFILYQTHTYALESHKNPVLQESS